MGNDPTTNRIMSGFAQREVETITLAAWRSGFSGVRRMNKVNARRARLVPGWVTVFGRVYHLGM